MQIAPLFNFHIYFHMYLHCCYSHGHIHTLYMLNKSYINKKKLFAVVLFKRIIRSVLTSLCFVLFSVASQGELESPNTFTSY